jgi:hypothetical protein
MESIEQFLRNRLKLKVNKGKSAVAQPSKRKFLGFRADSTFCESRGGFPAGDE